MAPDRKPLRGGRGRGRGGGADTGFREEVQSHADRAAALLARARAAGSSGPTSPKPSPASSAISSSPSQEAIPLPALIKSLANPQLGSDAMSIKEAIPIAGKLARAKLNTNEKLSLLNSFSLEKAGITSETEQHKIMIAFGVKKVGSSKDSEKSKGKGALNALSEKPPAPGGKRRRPLDDDALSREYGNITAPLNEPGEGDAVDYLLNEVLDEEVLKNRKALINRAPIMTAWATVVLEKLGFERREALSLAHCYVHSTSQARGISLGIIPASERSKSVNFIGSNQPHFELMGVKIPLMKVGKRQEWRGISQGQVVSPDNAFNYMKRSMHQTLPAILGSLMLLADSYTASTEEGYSVVSGADLLHADAYELYTKFRPSTAGEWGKKSTFFCGKALALRKGREQSEVGLWEKLEDDEQGQASEIRAFEKELQQLAESDVKQEPPEEVDADGSVVVKAEDT